MHELGIQTPSLGAWKTLGLRYLGCRQVWNLSYFSYPAPAV